jgi:formylglycine-generating enzyme required for sulfatase activity
VDIDYILTCDPAENVDVGVSAKDGAADLALPAGSLSGDLYNVAPGPRRIVFDPTKTAYTNSQMLTQFSVTLTPSPALPPSYMVVDLVNGGVTYVSTGTNLWADVTNDVYKTTKMVFRRIPAGTLMMGSPAGERGRDGTREEYHSVTLTDGYWIGVYEVTQRQWFTLRNTNTSYFQGNDWERRPIDSIAYKNIRHWSFSAPDNNDPAVDWPANGHVVGSGSFLQSLRDKAGGSLPFDLPTDAQWEYACRAGTTGALNNGTTNITAVSDCPVLATLGRYQFNGGRGNDGLVNPAPSCGATNATAIVGTYLPNAWGLYDMHGNVHEWCLDWYTGALGTAAATNPSGPASGTTRVRRGGSWFNAAQNCRSADRRDSGPANAGTAAMYIGFRVACPTGE